MCPLAEDTDAVFIILPHLFSFIILAASQAVKNGALRSIPISLSQSSSVHSDAGLRMEKPAWLHSISIPPRTTDVCLTISAVIETSERSHFMNSYVLP